MDFELIFSNKVDDPLEPLLKAAKTGKLGNMTFELNGKLPNYVRLTYSPRQIVQFLQNVPNITRTVDPKLYSPSQYYTYTNMNN